MQAYRLGAAYVLESSDPSAVPVQVRLGEGVVVQRSGAGLLLLYREPETYGRPLAAALAAGWCQVMDTAREAPL